MWIAESISVFFGACTECRECELPVVPPDAVSTEPSFPTGTTDYRNEVDMLSPAGSGAGDQGAYHISVQLLFRGVSFLHCYLLDLFFPRACPLPTFYVGKSSRRFFR